MAHNVTSRASSPADALRRDLDEAEKLVTRVRPENVEPLLLTLDRIDTEFDILTGSEIDLRPEQSRWDSLIQRVNGQATAIASAAAKGPRYARLRKTHAIGPATEFSFWWFLDQEASRQRRRLFVRLGAVLGSVLGGLALVYWVMMTFFPPDPLDVLYADVTYQLDQYSMEQNWTGALAVIDANLDQLPAEPDLLIWRGVLEERLDHPEIAEENLAQAWAMLSDQEIYYWNTLANRRLQVGDLDGAEFPLAQALALDPENSQTYFLMGGLAEARGDNSLAMEYYNHVFDLAESSDPQLAVIARVRVSQLMQSPNPFPTPFPSPFPTPTATEMQK